MRATRKNSNQLGYFVKFLWPSQSLSTVTKKIVRYQLLTLIYISVHLFENENRTSNDFSTVIKRVKTTLIKCTLLPFRKSVKCKKKFNRL